MYVNTASNGLLWLGEKRKEKKQSIFDIGTVAQKIFKLWASIFKSLFCKSGEGFCIPLPVSCSKHPQNPVLGIKILDFRQYGSILVKGKNLLSLSEVTEGKESNIVGYLREVGRCREKLIVG